MLLHKKHFSIPNLKLKVEEVKFVFLIFIILFGTINGFAQSQKFDVSSFVIPKDWKKEVKSNVVTYTKTQGNGFCIIAVYAGRAAGKDVDKEFLADWEQLVAKPYNVSTRPNMSKEQKQGWNILSGSVTVNSEASGSFAAMLYTHIGFDKMADAVILYNDDTFRKELEAFLTSFKADKTTRPAVVAAGNAATQPAGKITGSANLKGGGLTGLWMGFIPGGFTFGNTGYDYINKRYDYGMKYDKERLVTKFKVFFNNGAYCDNLPNYGLYDFEKNKNDKDESGYFKLDNGMITAKLYHYTNEVLYSYKAGNLKLADKYQFVRCKPVDGLKLDGSYISADPTSVLYYNSLGVPFPYIVFTSAGEFADVNFIGDYSHDAALAAGSGTYEIKDFTLILHYTDGRTIQRSFNANLDEDPLKTQKYFIGGRDVKIKP